MARRRVTVALLGEDQEFQRLQAEDAREAAAHHHLEVEVLFAENNPIIQIQQLFRVVHAPPESRPCAIVTETITGEGLERVARNAVKAGIGWVLINRRVPYLAELRQERPDLPICSVGTDQIEVGRIQGRQFRAFLPAGGQVLYIEGPPDTSVAQERLAGMRAAIADAGITVQLTSGVWTETSGEQAVNSVLRLKTWETTRFDLVGCQNDAMAAGALKALREFKAADLSRIPVTGCDGLLAGGRRLVDTRQLAATIVTRSNTGPAIDLVARHLQTRQAPPADVLLPAASYPEESRLGSGPLRAAGRDTR
jgi:ABC-type sugar transport system substrate-binding protein